ncbi:hypothetical protein [Herbiconiux ginsengi]|uniref:Immunity protein 35 n=1 Tax=Herbiconiux ginsengi TaxID=381665 RepID=A0A1H3S485_9MICO|nr:hypothetical protein [Herbiconiux ginsengi]SDZ32742.1 hypothetical protein SAMN05216554_3294 [Herbiconiux ginsengi]
MTAPSRPLTSEEHALLASLLEGEWEGAEQARLQLDTATHEGWWFTGSKSFDIAVDLDRPLIPRPNGILAPTDRDVYEGDTCTGGVVVWLTEGRISSFEYYWMTDEMPTKLPTPSEVVPR